MSVAVLVTHRGDSGRSSIYAPIATEAEFHDVWLTLAKAGNLYWIPQFATGVPIPLRSVVEVIRELEALRVAAEGAGLIPEAAKSRLVGRIDDLRHLFASLSAADVEEIFAG